MQNSFRLHKPGGPQPQVGSTSLLQPEIGDRIVDKESSHALGDDEWLSAIGIAPRFDVATIDQLRMFLLQLFRATIYLHQSQETSCFKT